jgi:hypothetical protein
MKLLFVLGTSFALAACSEPRPKRPAPPAASPTATASAPAPASEPLSPQVAGAEVVAILDRPLLAMCADEAYVYGIQESEPPRPGVPIRYDLLTLDRASKHVDRQRFATMFDVVVGAGHVYWFDGSALFAEPRGTHAFAAIEHFDMGVGVTVRLVRHGSAIFWSNGREVRRAQGARVDGVGTLADEGASLLAVDDEFFYVGGATLARVSRQSGRSEALPPVWDVARFAVDDGNVYWVDTRWSLHEVPSTRGRLGTPAVLEARVPVREIAVERGVAWANTGDGLWRFEGGRAESRHVFSAREGVFGRPAIFGGRVFVTVAPEGDRPRVVSLPL